jgi:hypothetical protein
MVWKYIPDVYDGGDKTYDLFWDSDSVTIGLGIDFFCFPNIIWKLTI